MLHRLQASDHRLDPGPHLLILLQQVRPLGCQQILTLAQGAVLFLERVCRALIVNSGLGSPFGV